jgi:hypothetical protein
MTSLVVREAALVKQYTTGSMSLLLRPDASTELVLHLLQRDGQVEAFVRCERGDFDQLSALWPQLQESLAGQKVRLAPLQESSLHDPNSPQSPLGGIDLSQSGLPSRRQSAPDVDAMPERPLSACSSWKHLLPGEALRNSSTPARPAETWA